MGRFPTSTRLPEGGCCGPAGGNSNLPSLPDSLKFFKPEEKTESVLPRSSQPPLPEPDTRSLMFSLKFTHNCYYLKGSTHSLFSAPEAASPMQNTQQPPSRAPTQILPILQEDIIPFLEVGFFKSTGRQEYTQGSALAGGRAGI